MERDVAGFLSSSSDSELGLGLVLSVA